MKICALVILTLAGMGCTAYRAAPLDVAGMERRYAARGLSDPALLKYLGLQKPPAEWNLELLARAAIFYHPDIAAAKAHAAALGAAEVTAGEIPNPSLAIDPEYSFNPDGVSPWVLGWTFDVPIETAGKREKRIAVAKADTQVARMEVAQAAWEVRARLRDALAEVVLDADEVELLKQEVTVRKKYVGLWQARLQAGEAASVDVDAARVDSLTARQAYFAAQGELANARVKLAAAIGISAAGLGDAVIDWKELANFSPLNAGAVQWSVLANRLDVRRALAEYASAEAALKLEIAKQYPDLHVGPGYLFDQGQNKFLFGASLELPAFNQNQGGVAEAIAHRRELAAKFLSLQAQAIGEAESALARYTAALQELAEANGQDEALSGELERGKKTFAAGEEDRVFLTGIEVQRQVTLRLRLDAIRKAEAARAALEDAIQRPLNVEGNS